MRNSYKNYKSEPTLSFKQIILLFIRNKCIEIISGILKMLYYIFLTVLLIAIFVGFSWLIGYIINLTPMSWGFSSPLATNNELLQVGLVIIFILILLVMISAVIYNIVTSSIKYIKLNWKLAKKGTKLNFFDELDNY